MNNQLRRRIKSQKMREDLTLRERRTVPSAHDHTAVPWRLGERGAKRPEKATHRPAAAATARKRAHPGELAGSFVAAGGLHSHEAVPLHYSAANRVPVSPGTGPGGSLRFPEIRDAGARVRFRPPGRKRSDVAKRRGGRAAPSRHLRADDPLGALRGCGGRDRDTRGRPPRRDARAAPLAARPKPSAQGLTAAGSSRLAVTAFASP